MTNNKQCAEPPPIDLGLCTCVRLTYIQHILLDNGVHDDGHQHVEEDSGKVLDAMVEVVYGRLIWTLWKTHRGHAESLQ